MTARNIAAVWLATLLTACGDPPGPSLDVTGVRLLAPLPGTNAGVAYLTIHNRSGHAIEIRSVRSAQFDKVEIHESAIENDVATMRHVATLEIPAGGDVALEPFGLHMMLVGPGPDVAPGTAVTLEIQHDDGVLIVSAPLQDRRTGN